MSGKLDRYAEQLGALGHPNRLAILRSLVQAGSEGAAAGAIEANVDMPASTLSHQLKRLVEAPRSGVNASHFGIQVISTDDVALASERFKRNGLPTRGEENTSCCYAVQDKVWVEDPDGNMWEVFVVKGDSPTMREGAETACCTPIAGATEDGLVQMGAKRGCC